jgi:hypothetical protein
VVGICEVQVKAFFGANGPTKLIFFHQVEEREVEGEYQPLVGSRVALFLTDGELFFSIIDCQTCIHDHDNLFGIVNTNDFLIVVSTR